MKITIVGGGYVGRGLACILQHDYTVSVLDIDKKMANRFQGGTTDKMEAYTGADYVVVCVPTDFSREGLETNIVESTIKDALEISPKATVIIKSTIPVGLTDRMRKKFRHDEIHFFPEFLREGHEIGDMLNPSRIVAGGWSAKARRFAEILKEQSNKTYVPIFAMEPQEAEAVKLFSNAYLAMRVAFFNEVDSFAMKNHLETSSIIEGVCSDRRIGMNHNNPSFGYGGYCLPKDTEQIALQADSMLLNSIGEANYERKLEIVDQVCQRDPATVGIYLLNMKADSTNHKEAAVLDIIRLLHQREIVVKIYDPMIKEKRYKDCDVVLFDEFAETDLILANRYDEELDCIKEKVFTRDIYGEN